MDQSAELKRCEASIREQPHPPSTFAYFQEDVIDANNVRVKQVTSSR